MAYRGTITVIEGENNHFFTGILGEDFAGAEDDIHAILRGEFDSLEGLKSFDTGLIRRFWDDRTSWSEEEREEWSKTYAHQSWIVTMEKTNCVFLRLTINGYDSSKTHIFMRSKLYYCG